MNAFGVFKKIHSPKVGQPIIFEGKPTYSVGQEVGFIGACQDLMLSKPLHVEATKLPSSETLGVKHSSFETLASFTVTSKSQDFSIFQTEDASRGGDQLISAS